MKKLLYISLLCSFVCFGQSSETIFKEKKISIQKVNSTNNEIFIVNISSTQPFHKKNNIVLSKRQFLDFINSLYSVFTRKSEIETEFYSIIKKDFWGKNGLKWYQLPHLLIEFKIGSGKSRLNIEDYKNEIIKFRNELTTKIYIDDRDYVIGMKLNSSSKVNFTNTRLNLREEPNVSSKVIKVFNINSKLNTQIYNDLWAIVTDDSNEVLGFASKKYLTSPKIRKNIQELTFQEELEIWDKFIKAQDTATKECDLLYRNYPDGFGECYNNKAKVYESNVLSRFRITRDVWSEIKHKGLVNKWELPEFGKYYLDLLVE